MPHCILAVVVAVAAGAGSGPALAASASGQFAVKGVGQEPCSTYLEAQSDQDADYREYGHYIAGYLTAANRLLDDTVDVTSWESLDVVAAYVVRLCRQKPDVRFVEAIEGVLAILMPHRLTSDAELVTVSAGDRSIRVYASVIERAKRALRERAFYDGPIDAEYGPSTRRAIRAFQKDNEIARTGLPDQRTLYLLFRPAADATHE